MEKLKKIDGSCAIVALLYVSGKDEDTVIRICTLHGFKEGKGMADKAWQQAATDLGIAFNGVAIQSCSLKKFIANHPKGLFLLGTHDHLFVLDAGLIVDPRNTKLPGLNRKIKQCWKITKN